MLNYLKSIITYVSWFIICFVFTLICLPITFLPQKIRRNRLYFFLTTIWSKLLVLSTFIKVKIENKNNLPKYPKDPAIFVMNHASAVDIYLVEILLKTYPHIWISKDSYGKIPLFGTLMKRMHILVRRENPRLAIKALLDAYKLAKDKPIHILLFPEGTRYDDGKVHDFLPGFAILAKKLNRPVIPVKIEGTNKIFPKKQFLIDSKASRVKLIVGEPFYYNEGEAEKDFVVRVKSWFV